MKISNYSVMTIFEMINQLSSSTMSYEKDHDMAGEYTSLMSISCLVKFSSGLITLLVTCFDCSGHMEPAERGEIKTMRVVP